MPCIIKYVPRTVLRYTLQEKSYVLCFFFYICLAIYLFIFLFLFSFYFKRNFRIFSFRLFLFWCLLLFLYMVAIFFLFFFPPPTTLMYITSLCYYHLNVVLSLIFFIYCLFLAIVQTAYFCIMIICMLYLLSKRLSFPLLSFAPSLSLFLSLSYSEFLIFKALILLFLPILTYIA